MKTYSQDAVTNELIPVANGCDPGEWVKVTDLEHIEEDWSEVVQAYGTSDERCEELSLWVLKSEAEERIANLHALVQSRQGSVVTVATLAEVIRKSDERQQLLIDADEDHLSGDKAYWAAREIHALIQSRVGGRNAKLG